MTELHTSESGPRWRPYPAYKDSGVPWLGKIPAHWEVKRIKHTSYIKGRIGWKGLRSEEFIDEGPYLITGTDLVNGQVVWESCYHVNEERYNEDPYIIVRENDLLITKDGTIGKTAIVRNFTGKATLNSGIFLVRPKNKNYIVDYLYWLLNSHVFTAFIDYSKVGSTISHLYQNIFVELKFPIPTGAEQQAVSQFLLKETAKIDALVAKKERQIELLQEKRTALISRAVTRGLDPNVPLKDSGIDWLGHIPAHWTFQKLKYVSSIRLSSVDKKFADAEISVLLCNYVDVYYNKYITPNINFMEATATNREIDEFKLKKGDVLITKDSESWDDIAIPAYVLEELDGVLCGYHLAQIRSYADIVNSEYLFWSFYATGINYQFKVAATGITRYGLGKYWLDNAFILVPSIEEQRAIADFLERETAKIDALITKIRGSIDKLKEYRTALISAAVTGKIDVRKEVAR